MPTIGTENAPQDADIYRYDRVPVEVAAAYIGTTEVMVRKALVQQRAPYGYAVQNEETGTWTYQISPGLLVKFKSGDLPAWRLNDLIDQIVRSVESVLELRAQAAAKVLCPGLLETAQKAARRAG